MIWPSVSYHRALDQRQSAARRQRPRRTGLAIMALLRERTAEFTEILRQHFVRHLRAPRNRHRPWLGTLHSATTGRGSLFDLRGAGM